MQAIRKSIDGPFDAVVERVKAVFKENGFGTLTELDVKKILKEKTGEDIERYTILGVCNPGFAHRAIQLEHEIGVMLPCTVLVHECGGKVNVVAQDPEQMVAFTGNAALESIAGDAGKAIAAAVEAL